MNVLTHIILHNWRLKLAALIAATLIWLFIKHDLVNAGSQPPVSNSAPARFSE